MIAPVLRFLTLVLTLASCCWAASATTAIKVDQAGYLPDHPKLAMVVPQSTDHAAAAFAVKRSKDNSVVFSGKLTAPTIDNDSGDLVQLADFSSVREKGDFYLDVAGVGRSWDFAIAPDVYNRVYYLAMRGFYGQRCGTAVDMAPDFPQYKHAVCHTVGAWHDSSGKQGSRPSAKGWHDAGDYGRYVTNSGISTGTLLWAWELYQNRIKNIGLHIPESGNGTPDILNEVRWNLDWMLSLQDADGGVWHKQTSTHFSRFIMPEDDKLASVVVGTGFAPYKGSCPTADTAAVAAIAARLFKPYDPAYSARVLSAAQKAWQWVEQNPSVAYAENPAGITTGAYSDRDCSDEHLWAAVELWRTTHDDLYSQYFLAHYRDFLQYLRPADPQSWSELAPLALWGYVLSNGPNAEAVNSIRRQSLTAADEIVARTNQNPYRVSLTTRDYIWGSNGVAANYSMQLLIANQFQRNPKYFAAAMDNLHYILGRNTFSLSWVTHVGQHAFQHPHHRPSAADGIDEPWPGLMSGGPNPGRQDAAMKQYVPVDTKPARAYIDVTGAYACNEIAINWNAPLVFSLAAAVSPYP